MYSIVLMVALSGGADTPALGHHGCNGGCYGGCYGGCSGGCYGGCYGGCNGGCHGGHHGHRGHHGHHRNHGCHGCNGGCYGGCWGGCYGGCTGVVYSGCCGCTGGYVGCYGTPAEPKKEQREKISADAPATIVVKLPAQAKLTIDGAATTSTSEERVFATPALPAGQDFYYTFKATVVREGRPIASEQRVRVRAGEKTPVMFDFATTEVVKK
jgi:uncharacterized protein (TIGR03000 family)